MAIISSSLLVGAFSNAPFTEVPARFEQKNFKKEVELVDDFKKRVKPYPSQQSQQAFQHVLLLGLADTKVGIYSSFHDVAVYALGYNHPDTVRLGYM